MKYTALKHNGRWTVQDDEGIRVMFFNNKPEAIGYASTLNEMELIREAQPKVGKKEATRIINELQKAIKKYENEK